MEGQNLRLSLPITRLPLFRAEKEKAIQAQDNTDSGLHVAVDLDLQSPITAVECDSKHQVDVQYSGNSGQVKVRPRLFKI